MTLREREVAALVVEGRTSKEIARTLGISDLTVRKHRENLLRKLGLRSTTELVARGAAGSLGERMPTALYLRGLCLPAHDREAGR